jgi:phosphopantetheinyl transferase (holo-ACP synthase)
MAGNAPATSQEFAAYLGRLLGRPVAVDDWVRLTSGQQARAGGWLAERGADLPTLREQLSASFQPAGFLGNGGDSSTPPFAAAAPPRQQSFDGSADNLHIGVDIQSVNELFPGGATTDLKTSDEVTAIFSLREISYAQSRPSPAETLTGIFAAKEALRKCNVQLSAIPLPELEVLPDSSGRPRFPGLSLSISHSGGFAIAVAASIGNSRMPPPTVVPIDALDTPNPPNKPPATTASFLIKLAIVAATIMIGLFGLARFGAFRSLH